MGRHAVILLDTLEHAQSLGGICLIRLSVLFIVSPHPEHLHCVLFGEHLVHQPMLDVDATGIGAGQVTNELLEGRRVAERVLAEYVEQRLGLRPQACGRELLGIALCLFGEEQAPDHQPGLSSSCSTGVAIPSRIDSRMPGIESR